MNQNSTNKALKLKRQVEAFRAHVDAGGQSTTVTPDAGESRPRERWRGSAHISCIGVQ